LGYFSIAGIDLHSRGNGIPETVVALKNTPEQLPGNISRGAFIYGNILGLTQFLDSL